MWWQWAITALAGCAALGWIAVFTEAAVGLPSMPNLAEVEPLAGANCPRVSILFAARDEAEKLPAALATLLALDYPNYEVIAVNDRSDDTTQQILETAAAGDPRLKAVHVTELPSGWLGKTHGLQTAFEHSDGEWIVFTDADVKFSRDLLRRAVALTTAQQIDHLPLLAFSETTTLGERILMSFFAMGFAVGTKPWRKGKPGSRFYVGVGAFQMVRRSAYIAMGEHKKLAMEVVDDIKLGKVMQDAGFRSQAAFCGKMVSVYWHRGVAATIRGTEKNFFAGAQYSVAVAVAQVASLLAGIELPWLALIFALSWNHGLARTLALAFAAIAIALPVLMESAVAVAFEISLLYALTQPIGALLLGWMLIRSTYVTLKHGGITWRGTFYPLEDLRRGMV
jgi:cellulose synthase/poly-beta-1,6-N-acetylglucosamine synthase-like glycosyltransferase